MKHGTMLLAGVILATLAQGGSAGAWWFADDGRSWPIFEFHEYDGSDVNRPGGTPDRPYWHGDDAVPLGMRWQDLEAAQAQAAADDAAAAAAIVPAPRLHTRPRIVRRHRFATRTRPRICVPAATAAR